MSGILKVGGSELINDNGGSGALQWGSGVPAGSVLQMVTPSVVVEDNALNGNYTNIHEVSITLKGGNSKILILHEFNWYAVNASGIGQRVYKKTSAGVTTSDTVVFDKGTADSSGPLHYYGSGLTDFYFTAHHHFVDDASSHNAGDTIYYGFFYRERSGTAQVPANNTTDGYFKTTLLEISG